MSISPRTLRPSSTFTPRSISGLALWLDASDSSTLFQNSDGTVPATATSDPVGYWGDKSGNGRHVTQSVSGSRPTISATKQNGRNALAFNGSSQSLSIASYNAENGLPGLTRYVVASMSSAGPTLLSRVYNGGGDTIVSTVSGQLRFFAGASTYSAVTSTNYELLTSGTNIIGSVYDGTAGSVAAGIKPYYNGAAIPPSSTSGTLPATLPSGTPGFWIGSNIGVNSFWPGRIIEYISYSRALGTADRQRLERYLSAKYGITLAPQVANADAQNWIDRVYANGGTVSTATAAAVNTFCESIASAGIRDRFYRMNLFAGNSDASLNAVRTPLFLGPSLGGTQYGGTTDTNNNFLAADYNEASGLQGNGSTKYLNTGVPMNFSNIRDYHLSSYVSSITSGNPGFIGADTSGDGVSPRFYQALVSFAAATRIWVWYNYGTAGSQSDNSSNSYAPGLLSGVGSASASSLYVGASSVGSAVAQPNETATRTFPIYVFATNNRNAVVSSYANARLGGYSLGLAMNATQVGQYNTALAAFNSSLGRA